MHSSSRLEALLGDLYASVLEAGRFDRFLCALGEASGSHLASMTVQDFRRPERSHAYSVGATEEELARYAEHAGDNIWINRSLPHLRAGAALDSDDFVDLRELKQSRYYNAFLRTIDTAHSVALCGEIGADGGALITLCRSERTGAYGGDAMALLQRIAPHWANACALRRRLDAAQAQAMSSSPLAIGVFMLDRRFRWREGNAAAHRVAAQGWWRGQPPGALEPASPASRAAWRQAQRDAIAGSGAAALFPLHDDQGRRVAFAALHALGSAAPGEDLPHYALFVRPLSPLPQSPGPDAGRLRALFGLTAAEAALALALHQAGDISAAAATLGIGERGARTRLQSIFDKTDCRRQGDLLRVLDALAELGG